MRSKSVGISAVLKEVATPSLFFVWIFTTLFVAFAGPFGTYDALPFFVRIVYWGGLITLSIFLAVSLRILWRIWLKGAPRLLEDGLVLTSLAILFGPIVAILNNVIWPETSQLSSWPFAMLLTFLIGCATVSLRHLLQTPDESAAVQKRDRLLQRLDCAEGVRLARISSDNHHIRVITVDGKEHRILMRMRDAVAEIDVEAGFCVHRSHWVATNCILDVVDQSGREMLRLTCGTILPIGPKYRPSLVEHGLLSA